jgi:hypothetical protein
MTLREVTRTVIKRVEDASGYPVVVNEDRSLMTLVPGWNARCVVQVKVLRVIVPSSGCRGSRRFFFIILTDLGNLFLEVRNHLGRKGFDAFVIDLARSGEH